MKNLYARTNYLLLYCDRFKGNAGGRTPLTVEVLQEHAPVLDTISVIDPQEIDRRFSNGDLCFFVRDGQRCIGLAWGHTGDCYIRGAGERLTLDSHSVYLYGVFTAEDARGRGIYNAIQEEFFRYYSDKGVTRVYAIIEKNNLIMKKIFLKAGFTIKSHIHYLRLHRVGVRYVHDYNARKMAVQFICREFSDCTII